MEKADVKILFKYLKDIYLRLVNNTSNSIVTVNGNLNTQEVYSLEDTDSLLLVSNTIGYLSIGVESGTTVDIAISGSNTITLNGDAVNGLEIDFSKYVNGVNPSNITLTVSGVNKCLIELGKKV